MQGLLLIHRYLRYARLGLRLLFPNRSEARYARAIRDSGLFDRAWYLACNPRLPRLCRLLPERHYVIVGEAVGLCPSASFSPRAYAHFNPDQANSGLAPLAHYLAHGQAEGRAILDLPAGPAAPDLPEICRGDGPARPARFAVVVHLHYPEIWDEIAARLDRQVFAFDLFVTISQQSGSSDLRARILARFPTARVWAWPNHGRDILPFVHLSQSGVLAPYAALCKLHGKYSPHRSDGAAWRHTLLDGVLGDGAQVQARLESFLADPLAGQWVADGHRVAGAAWWGPNMARAMDLLGRAGITAEDPDDLVFAAGSIYWVKPEVVAAVAGLPVAAADFEPEMGQVDGTTAHALERAFGRLVRVQGLVIRQASDLDWSRHGN